jgi:hypothetical protein
MPQDTLFDGGGDPFSIPKSETNVLLVVRVISRVTDIDVPIADEHFDRRSRTPPLYSAGT